MRISVLVGTILGVVCCLLVASRAAAHPGSGIVVTNDGEIFFTDTGRGVWKIDREGKLSYVPSSLFHWMALDGSGYFAGSDDHFGEWFERVTPQQSVPAIITCSDFPLTVGRDGNLYYANTRHSAAQVVRRTPSGRDSIVAPGTVFKDVTGIAAGPNGSLYVDCDGGSDRGEILKITQDGTVSVFARNFVRKDLSIVRPPETNARYCRGLDVDSLGAVYIAATGTRRVLKITPGGEVTTILQAPSPWSPTGVAVWHGEVFVLEWRDPPPSQTEVRRAWIPRVRKVGLDGKITVLTTVSR